MSGLLRGVAVAVFTLLAVGPLTAQAGGWVVVTLDSLPDVTAGQDVNIGFMVRQHGQRPLAGEAARIELRHRATGKQVAVRAKDQGPTGHYAAQFLLPQSGVWEWKINVWGEHPMPPLEVRSAAGQEAGEADVRAEPAVSAIADPVSGRWLAFAGAAAITAALWRSRRSWRRGAPQP